MQIGKNSVVTFHYTLRDDAGVQLESSRDGDPTLYLHGANNMLPALEEAFAGRSAGESFQITLTPAQAYGERRAGAVERVPAKYLKHEGRLRVGQVVRLHMKDGGAMPVTIVKVGKFAVDVDSNHPLAGRTLSYDIEIVDVRAATAEEIAHGHAHGVGGHNH
jgi:FKBP-type peptidyl-prolyl cis-trans isomerase SlyD